MPSTVSMCGARSRSLAATRSTQRCDGSKMWSSTEISQSRFRSLAVMLTLLPLDSRRQLADAHVLDLLEGPDALHAPLAAEAALLVAPAGCVRAEHRRVDVDRATPDASGHRRRGDDVGAVHLAREAVDAVVRDPHGVIDVPVADHRQDGAEDLLLRGRVRVV